MNRNEVIAEAIKVLPPVEDNIQPQIRIRVIDNKEFLTHYDEESMSTIESPLIHEVIFDRCYVSESKILRNEWRPLPEGYQVAWIPKEYFDFVIGGKDLKSEENQAMLNSYLLNPNQ